MSVTERSLRGFLPLIAVCLLLSEGFFDALHIGFASGLAVYAGVGGIVTRSRKTASVRASLILAVCDLVSIAAVYFVFSLGVLLILYALVLFRVRISIPHRHFSFVAASAVVTYCAAVATAMATGSTPLSLPHVLLHLALYPALISGGIWLLLRIASDARREVELERDDLLRRLNATNDALATMSHEFRTPLTMIHSSSQILLEERPGPLNQVQRRFVDTIAESTSRLIRFADELVARMKVESVWLNLQLQELDIRPIVKSVVQSMAPFAEQRARRLRYVYPHILSPVLADAKWIHQVLVNLIHNAIKYTEVDGNIVLSVKENEECAVVSVSDDGGGIWGERTTDVFKKYFQENRNVEGSSDGAGLGLAIAKQIIEKHNGKVYVGSVPGMGSIFSFTLPIVRGRRA